MTAEQPKPRKFEHPLTKGPLPEWLSEVNISPTSPTVVLFGQEQKRVPIDLVIGSLTATVGQMRGSFSMAPELAQLFAESTENSSWKNIPTETTTIRRVEEDSWEVRVGDYKERFTREELEGRVIDTLLPPEDQNPTTN